MKEKILIILPINLVLILFVLSSLTLSQSGVDSVRERNREKVGDQYEADIQRISEIKKRMKSFIDDINNRIGIGKKTKIDSPVDSRKIIDIKKIEHNHTDKKVPDREFAYVNSRKVKMMSACSINGRTIGSLHFKERIEIIVRSDHIDSISGVKAPWFLIKKRNEDEGWVFGFYLQKKIPNRIKSIESEKGDTDHFGKFMVPVIGRKTSKFGYRIHPVTKKRNSFHKGIDIAASAGTPVKAAAGGIIRKAGFNKSGYGNLVVIEHGKNLATYYGHLSEIIAYKGKNVIKGQLIGKVGATGSATGPHLHFEVRRGNTALNPDSFLR